MIKLTSHDRFHRIYIEQVYLMFPYSTLCYLDLFHIRIIVPSEPQMKKRRSKRFSLKLLQITFFRRDIYLVKLIMM